jgi:hypothetical protein
MHAAIATQAGSTDTANEDWAGPGCDLTHPGTPSATVVCSAPSTSGPTISPSRTPPSCSTRPKAEGGQR